MRTNIYRVEETLRPGQERLVKNLGIRLGGSGTNAGNWLAVSCDEVHLFALIGRIDRSRHILAQMDAYPWDHSGTQLYDSPINHSMILIDDTGDRTSSGSSRTGQRLPSLSSTHLT